MKVIIVGRHQGELPGVEIIGQENILFSLNKTECEDQLINLMTKYKGIVNGIIFQNVPGIVAASLLNLNLSGMIQRGFPKIGFMISKPGERLANVSKTWEGLSEIDWLKEMLEFVNVRAKVDIKTSDWNQNQVGLSQVTITLDPVSKYEFDHIEWF